GPEDPGPARGEGRARRRPPGEGRRRRLLGAHLQDGRRPAARRRQGLRAGRGAARRRPEELSLSQGHRARLSRGANDVGLQPPQPERQADVRVRIFVRRLTTRCAGAMEAAANRERECWRCGAETAGALACPRCEAIQRLDRDVDLFAVLGLPRRLPIDPVALERRYHDASRLVHPDRHQPASPEERELSLAASTAVNRAYRTLRDPVARARYWLELHGERLAEDGARVPPEIAAEVFETQERLAHLPAAGPRADRLRAQLRAVRDPPPSRPRAR